MTKAHELYLKKLTRYKKFIKITRILVFIAFLSLWEVAARLDWIDEFLQADDRAKDSNGYSGYDDGFCSGSEPDNE